MKHIKQFNESNSKKIITRSDEQNIIGYKIPDTFDVILGRTPNRLWVVKTSEGLLSYSTNEMEEIYNLDLIESDLERLGWTS
jgi:hypothetical protein